MLAVAPTASTGVCREQLRKQVMAAQLASLQRGTAGELSSVHDTSCGAALSPLALPPSLQASMAARAAAATALETRAGAALRPAGTGERSGVIAGPAFSQLEHIDQSITTT